VSHFLRGFYDELIKLAKNVPNALPASAKYRAAIPVQPIPSGASTSSQTAFRPPTPAAPAYQAPQPQQPAASKRGGGSSKPVGSNWLQMADRSPTETTAKFVHRQYGVPERQMGVNKGQVFPDASDAKMPQRMRSLAGSAPIDESRAPALRQPQIKDTSKMNVPPYLQQSVGGIRNQPQPYVMPGARGSMDFAGGAVGFEDPRGPRSPKPTTVSTAQQPAQAGM
jgi:hypothetical protein